MVDLSELGNFTGAYKISIKVNDVEVETHDLPAANGAFHVLGEVLVPPHKPHEDEFGNTVESSGWEHWER